MSFRPTEHLRAVGLRQPRMGTPAPSLTSHVVAGQQFTSVSCFIKMGVMHLPVGCCEGEMWSWVPGPMSHGSASSKHGSSPGLEQDSACCVRGLLHRESLQNVWWLPKRHSVTLGLCHQPQCDLAKLVCPVLSWPLNLQAGQELRPVTTPGDVFILTVLGFHRNAQFTGKAGTSSCCVERHLDQFTLKKKKKVSSCHYEQFFPTHFRHQARYP